MKFHPGVRGGVRHIFVAGVATLLLVFPLAGCGDASGPVAAKITAFKPPEGGLKVGTAAEAAVRVKNAGAREETFWVGYGVRGPNGTWHSAPPAFIKLAAGEESEIRRLSTPPLAVPGYYGARAVAWKEKPVNGGGEPRSRLASIETQSAFRVFEFREEFDSPLASRWKVSSRKLGRGRLEPTNVKASEGLLKIELPEGTFEGGQIESRELHSYGFYAARIKVPDVPSSITGFFLYRPPDLASEIDIEIFNDPSGNVMFTTYAGGNQTHTETVQLSFDPTRAFHNYAFLYGKRSVTFFVDGKPVKTYESGLPDRPMNLYLNAWYPTWLGGQKPRSDHHAEVEWVEY